MRTVTPAFQAKLDLSGGAEPRTLLEIDAVGGTLDFSDQTVTVDARVYSSIVLEFGELISQIVSGEGVVRVASMSFSLSNIVPIDDLIVAGTEVRVYDWYEGLATADKALRFKGTISGKPGWDDLEISFSANDIFQKLNKTIGRPLLEADWSLADPDYYGFTIPILIGAGENLECLPIEAGAASTVREDFNPADTTIKLTSATSPIAFPSSGTVIIGNEEYVYTGISTNDLTGVAPHSDIIYPEGSTVLEKTNLKFLAGESFPDTPVKAITNLSILPFNSRKIAEKVAIDAAFYTINLTETISSKVYATIVLTQINAIRKAVFLAVTTQPNQPITTHKIDVSPSHGHPPANVTIAYFMDSIAVSGATSGNTNNFTADGALIDGSIFFNMFLNAYVRTSKSAADDLVGTLVSAKVKCRCWTNGSINFNLRYVLNGVQKVSEGKTVSSSTAATFTTASFSLSGASWSDFQNSNTYCEVHFPAADADQFICGELWLELVYTPPNPTTAVTINESVPAVSNRIADAVVGGDTVADTLLGRLVCNFEGYKDKTDGHYTGTPTTQPLIEKPPDVTHFLWEKFSNGAVHADLDIAGSFLEARTNLPASYKFGFALTWQVDLDKLSAQLAQQAHSRFFTSAGVAKFARILESGTPVKVIDTDDYSPLTEDLEKKLRIKRFGGAVEDIINKVEIRYKHNSVLGARGNPDAYANNSESTDAAATTSISTYGERRRRTPWLMWAVRDDTMADDLRDKFLNRNQFPRTTTVFPSWVGLSLLEPSDLIELIAQKLRVFGRLSEILNIGNISEVPKNFLPTEIMLTVWDLLFIILRFTDEAQISDEVKIDIDAVLTDEAQAGDTLTKIDVDAVLTDTAQAGDAVTVDITIPLGDTAQVADVLTQLKSLWKFDSTRQFNSIQKYNSAPNTFWFPTLSDTTQVGDALTKIDVNAVLTDGIQAGDVVSSIDKDIPFSDGAQFGDSVTIVSFWKFDSTRKYDSSKKFNSAP